MDTGFLLLEAIQKNCFLPTPKERDRFTVSRVLRTSPKLEGDSEMGLILYIGIGKSVGMTPTEIQSFLCIDKKEYTFKHNTFRTIRNNKRVATKIKLITNYMKFSTDSA